MWKVFLMAMTNIVITLAFASAQVVDYSNRSSSPQTFTYLDSNGRFAGDSVQTGNIVIFHDARGNMTGSAVTTSPSPSMLSEHYLDAE